MKTQSLLLALGAVPAALAHTVFTDFYVNGVAQGDGVAMRMRLDPAKASFPLENLSSNDLACNVDGSKGVARVQSVEDGDTLSFEFRSWPNDPSKERLDRGHKGPCAVYLKKVDSAIDDVGNGDGWFKLFDDGYEKATDQWCTDKLIDNNGLLSVVLPKGLKGGYYLARPEILALHAANSGDPQFYAGCAQIFLKSSGDLVPEETVSIPGYVHAGEESVSFDIYNTDNALYPVPGPAVAKLSSSSSAAGTNDQAQTSQTEGERPAGCICENANWCGKEVSSYSDETGCWASAQECWDQGKVCWDTAPPTGNAGCNIWQTKCEGIQAQCNAKNFNGPPDKGEDLTPKHSTIDVGLIIATSSGGIDSTLKTSSVAAESSSSTPKSTSAALSAAADKTSSSKAAAPTEAGGYSAAIPTSAQASKKTTVILTVPASESAPAPTGPVCPSGYDCVTQYTTVVKTEVEYVTVYSDKKRRSLHHRRHGH
ncbi:lytic polysaccharide monooxygenase [Lophiostoma macrostomum CBS 122681]|uniref:AA9 family lytic polysaccharide monooxygenase n=1 Tax=Lophiostoma macrostomum CBS 122681 TaxID=1314788 RepID=A0A6A6TJF4_9PLEO|nr:lytic polysaccharide monooxygenase [Lophiostoma macrostomum CBS 122681]